MQSTLWAILAKVCHKGDGSLLCKAPFGPFWQKTPVPFMAPNTKSTWMMFRQISPQVKSHGKAICRILWTTSQQLLRNIKGWIHCYWTGGNRGNWEQRLRFLCLLRLLAVRNILRWSKLTNNRCMRSPWSILPNSFYGKLDPRRTRKTTNSTSIPHSINLHAIPFVIINNVFLRAWCECDIATSNLCYSN